MDVSFTAQRALAICHGSFPSCPLSPPFAFISLLFYTIRITLSKAFCWCVGCCVVWICWYLTVDTADFAVTWQRANRYDHGSHDICPCLWQSLPIWQRANRYDHGSQGICPCLWQSVPIETSFWELSFQMLVIVAGLIAWICWLLIVGMALFGSLGGQCTVMIILLGVFAHFFDKAFFWYVNCCGGLDRLHLLACDGWHRRFWSFGGKLTVMIVFCKRVLILLLIATISGMNQNI